MSSGSSTRMRAAASSSASGIPTTARHIAALCFRVVLPRCARRRRNRGERFGSARQTAALRQTPAGPVGRTSPQQNLDELGARIDEMLALSKTTRSRRSCTASVSAASGVWPTPRQCRRPMRLPEAAGLVVRAPQAQSGTHRRQSHEPVVPSISARGESCRRRLCQPASAGAWCGTGLRAPSARARADKARERLRQHESAHYGQ